MKVQITKDQAKKLFGGVKFSLNILAMITDEEKELIKKYNVGDEVLFTQHCKILTWEFDIEIKINDLVIGKDFTADNIQILKEYEAAALAACGNLSATIDELKKFGGSYIVEV